MIRNITELSREELLKVFHANEQLQNDVLDDIIDTEMHWISEQLDYVRQSLTDWSVGTSSHIYLDVRNGNEESFVDGVIQMQNDYCVLADDENEFINAVVAKIEAFNSAEMYSDEYYTLESEVAEMAQTLANKLASHFKDVLDGVYDSDYQAEHFTGFYAHERIANCYIETDDGDFTLYEDIAYTKKYT